MGAIYSKVFANILAADVGLNLLMWSHAALYSTEKYFDMTGALTYWIMIITGILQRNGNVSSRQIINSALTMLWSGRLGSFLVNRIGTDHIDVRFNYVRTRPAAFLVFWATQMLWCFLTAFPLYTLLAKDDTKNVQSTSVDYLSWTMWSFGFVIEVVADMQKRAFRANPINHGKFITSGLWAYSQHPNYAGEMIMAFAMWLSCSQSFVNTESAITFSSPVFVWFLLKHISGVRLLDAIAKKRWSNDPAYAAYCARTPVLFPLLSRVI
jgi:steroid 5-alpha reductase family enzyme